MGADRTCDLASKSPDVAFLWGRFFPDRIRVIMDAVCMSLSPILSGIFMSDGKVQGKVHLIEETKTYGQKGFRKRLVVLEQSKGRFDNYIPVEFVQDNCDAVDQMSVGNEVEISYRLNGRRWQKDPSSEVKFFLNLEALDFRVLDGNGAGSAGTASTASANAALDEAAQVDEEDIPF